MVVGSVVDGEVVEEVVADEVVMVASAAGDVEEAAEEVEGGGLVVTIGASVLATEGSPLTGPADSARTADALTVFPERSAEAADEPHAAVPITTSTRTAICSLFDRLTLWLRQRLSPLPREGTCVIGRS